jgi:hypothetical protein
MKRKTIEIENLKQKANWLLKYSERMGPEWRRGVATLLECALSETGNYKGYNNLNESQVPAGEKPGIIFDDVNGNHQYPDDSRRFYY